MDSFGKTLKKAREQNGLSLKQVSVAIKVNAVVLDNIEKENFEQLPKAVFTRGLIRTYCKYLEIDEEAVLENFDQQTNYINNTGKRADLNDNGSEQRTPFFLIVSRTLIPLLVLAVLTASGYGVFLITQKYKNEVSVVKTDDIQAIHTAKSESTETEVSDGTAPTPKETVSATQSSTPITAAKSTNSPTTTAAVKQETISEAEITQRITLEPSAKTLVQIQIDDDEVQKIILRPDVNRTFQARKRIKLNISDAGAVNIIHNRKDLGVLGVLGQSLELEFPNSSSQTQ